jgi:glycosyltransferase involved in cell wall biosynthesis
MHITLFGSFTPSLIKFRGPLMAEMVRRGHRVCALGPPTVPDMGAQIRALGAEYVPMPMQRRGLNPIADVRLILRLARTLRSLNTDIFLGYTIKPVVYGMLAARLAGVPRSFAMITGLGYAFTETSGLRRRMIFSTAKGLYAAGLRLANGVIFQNPDDRTLFARMGVLPEAKPWLITGGSGVDLEHYGFSPVQQESDAPVFLCLSRLIRAKGVGEFAEAARRIRSRHPNAVFRVAGPMEEGEDGITPDELAAWKRDCGLETLGPVEDVRPLIANASVYVLPSYYREGTPRSILEAMSMGRAVITTDAPGCRETVEDGVNGFLIPVHGVDRLEQAMERFITEPDLARTMGEQSRRLAEERFDVKNVNRAILDFMGVA